MTFTELDNITNLTIPDLILPGQYFAANYRKEVEGELRLMSAVLADGIDAYVLQNGFQRNTMRFRGENAKAWVEDEDATHFYSFNNVCEILGLNPTYLRKGLGKLVRQAQALQGADINPKQPLWKQMRRPRS